MNIKVLSQKDMGEVFTMADAIGATREAMGLYAQGKANIPTRVNLEVPAHKGNTQYMYGHVAQANALGVKIVSTYPGNIEKGLVSVPATMVLMDEATGYIKAIIDGTQLTRIRTGAVAGMATDLLARKDSSVFALFGTGGQAPSQLEAVLTVRPIELVKVFDVNVERAKAFAQEMTRLFGEKFQVEIIAVDTPAKAVANADIITTVTTSPNPVFDGTLVKKGVHVNGVGSYLPQASEVDEYVIVHADKVFVDTKDGALKECGNLIKPIQKGTFCVERVTGEIGEVVNKTVQGRETEAEMTVFITTGSAVLDLVTAEHIYQKAQEHGLGQIIEM